MEHHTCDKCGMPMEHMRKLRIDTKEYDICTTCKKKIMEKNLEEVFI